MYLHGGGVAEKNTLLPKRDRVTTRRNENLFGSFDATIMEEGRKNDWS